MPAPPAARWLTGRTREMVFTVEFSLPLEWAPLIDTRVHYVQRGELLAAVDAAYRLAPTWGGSSGTRGPYVTLTPEVQVVSGSYEFNFSTGFASPYAPDSATPIYARHQLQMGWRLVIYPGDGAGGGVNVFVPVGSPVTAWAPGAPIGDHPGPMGFVTGVGPRAAPNDWERTHGPTYGAPLTGTVVFSGGVLEEYFENLDEPTTQDIDGRPLTAHASELGQLPLSSGLSPWARRYTERRQAGTTQSIEVDLGALGSWSATTAPNVMFPNSNWSAPFAQAKTFCHALGSAGATVNSSYALDATWSAGGWDVGPITATLSNAGGSVSATGGTATTNALPGSSAWPAIPSFLPGGGQVYRGGVQIGGATTQVKLIPPEQRVFTGTILRADGASNAVPMSVEIGNYQSGTGASPSVLTTLTGVTNAFSQTYLYDDRAVRLVTDAGNNQTHANGSSDWYVLKTAFPDNSGVRLVPPSGESVGLPRMCLRGRRWSLWELEAPALVPVLAAPWPSYTLAPGVTASVTGGILSLTNAGTVAAGATFDASAPVPEYRYHQLRFRSIGSANQPLTVSRVGGPGVAGQVLFSWTRASGADGAWTEVELDGLEPYTGLVHLIALSSAAGNWVVNIPAGATIEIEWLKAKVSTFARFDALHQRWDGTRGVTSVVDGWPQRLLGIGGAGGGWDITKSATPSASKPWGDLPPLNGYIGSSSYFPQAWWYDSDNTYCMAGGGLQYDPIDGWDIVVNKDPGTLYAQDVFERLLVYPGAGDVFGLSGGAYGLTTTAQYGIVLGALATGLLVGEEETTPDVVAYVGTERARGVPATAENYARLTPALKIGETHDFRLDPEDDAAQTVAASGLDRTIVRTLWLLVGDILSDPLAVDTVRRRIVTAQGKRLACYWAEDRVLDVLSAEHPADRWLSLDVDPHTRQLWGLGKLGSELVLYVSEDFGDTIWEVDRVTGKSGVVIADPVRGVTATYYEDASGAVQQLLRLPDGTTVGPTAVQLSGAALSAKVLSGDTDEWSAGRHLLKVRQAGVLKVIAGQDLAGATFEPWIV